MFLKLFYLFKEQIAVIYELYYQFIIIIMYNHIGYRKYLSCLAAELNTSAFVFSFIWAQWSRNHISMNNHDYL